MDNEKIWLIAGLGNPGKKYDKTWHNLGFLVLEYLSQDLKISVNKIKFKGIYGTGEIEGNRIILLKPATFMNNSGESLKEAVAYFKIPIENVIVIYDDIDIKSGKIRIRLKGSGGTHNGMKSVITHLNSNNFPRIRVGCGPLPDNWDIVDYVLSKIPESLHEEVFQSIKMSAESAKGCVKYGIQKSMNMFNTNGKEKND